MIKQSNWGTVGAVWAIVAVTAMIVLVGYDAKFGIENYPLFQESKPQASPTLPTPEVKILELTDCIVEVSAHYKGQRRYGTGVIMERNGGQFVLTSEMIFVNKYDEIVVRCPGGLAIAAEHFETNSEFGLTALSIPRIFGGFRFNDAPNLPPDAATTVYNIHGKANAQSTGYIKPDWMILAGLDETFVGSPLVNGGQLSGLVIGMNSINATEAIAVGNRALCAFADQVTLGDAPPVYDPSIIPDAPPVFHPPANPNMLFGNER
jgi:hypothetical protein